ncbi:IPT/TIG domain-containing protein [Glycomyces luteolus]|uniref:IPT/TIG domain-containing protein n=1 Tax=Glycomyces luteolus TaxID=2670330 RepID=A0A9X3PKM3_9ACTN|nr:IPT/TIG domain-containing protein [Glycomyces luteolus]MDA1360335.1 IPT/TIG domain-containing protein [Glycomyces luteolus]
MTQAQQRPELDRDRDRDRDLDTRAPSIEQASPESGREGDTITIRGSHLVSVDKCTFQVGQDSRRGEVVHRGEDNQVKVRVPRGLSAGGGQISVSNGTGESNKIKFTVRS